MNHQPYLLKRGETLAMLFCTAEDLVSLDFNGSPVSLRPWQLAWKELPNGQTQMVNVPKVVKGFPVVLECNPSVYRFAGQWYLTYTIGLNKGNLAPIVYHKAEVKINLETMEVLSDVVLGDICFSFTETNNQTYKVSKDKKHLLDWQNKVISLFIPDLSHIVRVVNQFDTENVMLTVKTSEGYCSFLFEPILNRLTRIKNLAGEDVYKSSLLDKTLAYAVRLGDFEDREIVIETLP